MKKTIIKYSIAIILLLVIPDIIWLLPVPNKVMVEPSPFTYINYLLKVVAIDIAIIKLCKVIK